MTILSSRELTAMGRYIPTPFNLAVADENGDFEIRIDSILRVVPGKRLVALSHWQNRIVIVKLFFHSSRWKRKILRDLNGINLLRQAKIPTPNLLLQTTTTDKKAGLLIIEYLHQGVSLATLFQEANDEQEKKDILHLTIKCIASCHQAGVWQKDIHLDNFMLSSGTVYVLDGGDIKAKESSLNLVASLENLAMFVAQFPVELDEEWPSLIDTYRKHRANFSGNDYDGFPARIIKARQKRLTTFEDKLNRSTTATRCEQSARSFYVYDRSIHSRELERFISDPDSFIDKEKLLKDGNSSTVALIQIAQRDYVLKRYNIKGFWHGLARGFRHSRARNSWCNASVLEMLGVATAHPYLYLEERAFWFFRRRAYFLCEYLQADDLGTAWQKQETGLEREEEIIALFRKLFRILFDYRISHGDMKATNFLIKDKQLYVLDLDVMMRNNSELKFSEKFAKDMKRFQRNWLGSSLESGMNKLLLEVEKF